MNVSAEENMVRAKALNELDEECPSCGLFLGPNETNQWHYEAEPCSQKREPLLEI